MSLDRFMQHRAAWSKKTVLAAIFQEWYGWIKQRLIEGQVLELGSGPGFFKEYFPECIASDIVPAPWLNVVLDAETLPFAAESVANMVMMDVVHHLARPFAFFREAVRVLIPRGRIIILDVQISPFSYPVYAFLHHEPVNLSWSPDTIGRPVKDPFDSNQAITSLIFGRYRDKFLAANPELTILERKYFSFLTYPLSGGFEHKGIVTEKNMSFFRKAEKVGALLPRFFAFRTLIVIEKKPPSSGG